MKQNSPGDNSTVRETYFDLAEHSYTQVVVFLLILFVGGFLFLRFAGIPLIHIFFEDFLEALVDIRSPGTNLYTRWLVTAYPKTPTETVYGFNPILALLPITFAAGIVLAVYITAILPQKIGLMRQKIEREIINTLDRISRMKYGEHTESELREIVAEIMNSDIRQLHDLALNFSLPYEDLDALQKALKWREASIGTKIVRLQHAIRLYLRLYFTIQYSNAILGLVYIGAAMLIIIIGIRGLKFIPASEPSIILFALALEFILLIFYAITVMYSKQEEGEDRYTGSGNSPSQQGSDPFFAPMSDNSRDVENLLRAFAGKRKK